MIAATLAACGEKDTDSFSPAFDLSPASVSHHGVDNGDVQQHFANKELDYYLQRHTPQDEGYDIVMRYMEQGDTAFRTYLPPGHLTLANTLVHHRGKSVIRDRHGRLVIGQFLADTLASGIRIDSSGIYGGMMNRHGEANGHGAFFSADGSYYEGHWEHDQRQGFGLSISSSHLKVGAWLRDEFRGERMNYHSDRIYGIDISRYQHERGRRRYRIDWSNLRVVNLGRRISSERVLDTLNYPVSFVYVKSTEGVSIENKYYEEDDANARLNNIPVGAYHFFSTTTPPEEQARHFLLHSYFRHGDLPPMLDVEPSEHQIETMGGPLVLFSNIRVWLQMVEHDTHTRPIIYVNQRFANTYLDLAPDLKETYHFWIARYGEYKPDIHLDIWQLTGDGRVKGITPEVDINVFHGYQTHWEDFLRNQTVK